MSPLMQGMVGGFFVAWVGGYVMGFLFKTVHDLINAITSKESE